MFAEGSQIQKAKWAVSILFAALIGGFMPRLFMGASQSAPLLIDTIHPCLSALAGGVCFAAGGLMLRGASIQFEPLLGFANGSLAAHFTMISSFALMFCLETLGDIFLEKYLQGVHRHTSPELPDPSHHTNTDLPKGDLPSALREVFLPVEQQDGASRDTRLINMRYKRLSYQVRCDGESHLDRVVNLISRHEHAADGSNPGAHCDSANENIPRDEHSNTGDVLCVACEPELETLCADGDPSLCDHPSRMHPPRLSSGMSKVLQIGMGAKRICKSRCAASHTHTCDATVPDGELENQQHNDTVDGDKVYEYVEVLDDLKSATPNRGQGFHNTLEHRLQSYLLAFAVFFIFSLHSLIEGVGLGSYAGAVSSIGVSILLHKGLAAFAVGTSFVDCEMTKRSFVVAILIFSLMTPVGVLVGLYEVAADRQGRFTGYFTAAAAGALIFISVCELIPKAFKRKKNRTVKTLSFVAGCGVLCWTAVGEGHK